MRIAVITTSFPDHPGDPSGHFVAAEVEELALAGHDVHLIRPSLAATTTRRGSVTHHTVPSRDALGWPGAAARIAERPWRLFGAVRFVRDAERTVRRIHGVDRIEAHWMVPSVWPIAMSSAAPLHVTTHGGDVRLLARLPSVLRERIVSAIVERADRITFAGHHLRRDLTARLSSDLATRLEAISRVRSPLLRVTIPAGRRPRSPRGRATVVVVGRLIRSKRVDLAIRAVAGLAHPAKVIVVGDGPDRDALAALARDARVEVAFHGLVDRDRTHALIADADVLLHTSAAEGAPSVVREARVLGVPVIATASGDIARWAERDPGIAIAKPSTTALTACLERTLVRG